MENQQFTMPHIEKAIKKYIKNRELVNVLTEVGAVVGYIFGIYVDPISKEKYCEIWIIKSKQEVVRSFDNYFLVKPAQITFITPEVGERYYLPVVRYQDKIDSQKN